MRTAIFLCLGSTLVWVIFIYSEIVSLDHDIKLASDRLDKIEIELQVKECK